MQEHRKRPVTDQYAGCLERTPEHVTAVVRRSRIFGTVRQGGRTGRSLRENGSGGCVRRFRVRKFVQPCRE